LEPLRTERLPEFQRSNLLQMTPERLPHRAGTTCDTMSAVGQKRQFGDILITSGFPLKADIRRVA
jgi:hypothetical protein